MMAYFIGGLLGAMVDPLTAGAGVGSYFIGKSRGPFAAWIAVAVFGLLLAALSAMMMAAMQDTMQPIAWVLRVLAVAAWFGISTLVAKLRASAKGKP